MASKAEKSVSILSYPILFILYDFSLLILTKFLGGVGCLFLEEDDCSDCLDLIDEAVVMLRPEPPYGRSLSLSKLNDLRFTSTYG